MKQINKVQMLSMSALLAGSLGAFADNGIRIEGEKELVPGQKTTYQVYLDNDQVLSTFQFRLDIPEGLRLVTMPEATDRIPTKGTWQADWTERNTYGTEAVGDNVTGYGSIYVTYLDNNLKHPIVGENGAICTFTLEAVEGYESNDDVTLSMYDAEVVSGDGNDTRIKVANQEMGIKVVASRVALAAEPSLTALYPADYSCEKAAAEKQQVEIKLLLDNTIKCSGLQFDIETEGMKLVTDEDGDVVYTKGSRVKGTIGTSQNGEHKYRVTISNSVTNESLSGATGQFITIYANIEDGWKEENATVNINGVVLSAITEETYVGKGYTLTFENLAYTDNNTYYQAYVEDQLKPLYETIAGYGKQMSDELPMASRNEDFSTEEIKNKLDEAIKGYDELHEATELTMCNVPTGLVSEIQKSLSELFKAACKWEVETMLGRVTNNWLGNEEEDLGGAKDASSARKEENVKAKVAEIETAYNDLKTAVEGEIVAHDKENHDKIMADAENLLKEIDNLQAYVGVLGGLDVVKEALKNYDEATGKMHYIQGGWADGEDFTATVAGVRSWVEATATEYAEKFGKVALPEFDEEGELKGIEWMAKKNDVYDALNLAAIFDANHHALAATNAWEGDEENEIEGALDNILVKQATAAEAGQYSIQEDIDAISGLIQQMWDKINGNEEQEAYQYMGEEDHEWFETQYTTIINAIKDLQEKAAEAANDAALDRINGQLDLVTKAIKENYDDIVDGMMFASQVKAMLRAEGVNFAPIAPASLDDEEVEDEFENIRGLSIDAIEQWVEMARAEAEADHAAKKLDENSGIMGAVMVQYDNIAQALNYAAMYDAGRYAHAVKNAWFGDEEEGIEGARENVLAKIESLGEVPGAAALAGQVELLEGAIGNLVDVELPTYVAYNEENHQYFIDQYNELTAAINSLKAAAAEAANEAAWARVNADLDLVKEAIRIYEETIQTLMYAQNNEQFDITAAKLWVEETEAELKARYDLLTHAEEEVDVEEEVAEEEVEAVAETEEVELLPLDENTDIHQAALGQMSFVYNTLFEAAKWDANWYYNAANTYYNGGEDIVGAKENINAKIESASEDDKATLLAVQKDVEDALAQMEKDLAEYTAYNYTELHADIVAQYEKIMTLIGGLEEGAAAAANAAAWVRIQNDLALVTEAIEEYDQFVANTLMYAQNNAIELRAYGVNLPEVAPASLDEEVEAEEEAELTGVEGFSVDAAEQWVALMLADYEEAYKAGELDENSGVKGYVAVQLINISDARNNAAKYDAMVYTQSAFNAWVGDEDNEIVGAKDEVDAKLELLSEAGQSPILEAISDLEEKVLKPMLEAYNDYVQYTEEGHKVFIDGQAAAFEQIAHIQNMVKEALNDAAWEGIQDQLDLVKDAIKKYDETVAGMMYAGQVAAMLRGQGVNLDPIAPASLDEEEVEDEFENIRGFSVDAVAQWVDIVYSEYEAAWENKELNEESGIKGAAAVQLDNIAAALNAAGVYDAMRYYNAVSVHYAGPTSLDEDIEEVGVKNDVMARMPYCFDSDKLVLESEMIAIESALAEFADVLEDYFYTTDDHAAIVATAGQIMELIDELEAHAVQAHANALEELEGRWEQALTVLEKYDTFYGEEGYNVRKNAIDYMIEVAEQPAIANATPLSLDYILDAIDELLAASTMDETIYQIEKATEAVEAAEKALEGPHYGMTEMTETLEMLQSILEGLEETDDYVAANEVIEPARNIQEAAAELIAKAAEQAVTLGDVNKDGRVRTSDFRTVINYIVGLEDEPEAETYEFVAADANEDGEIGIGDAVVIMNAINLNHGVIEPKGAAQVAGVEALEGLARISGRQLCIDNNFKVAGLVVELEGVAANAISLASGANGMQLMTNTLANGNVRVVVISEAGLTIAPNAEVLDINGRANIVSVVAADANGVQCQLNVENATGIDAIVNAVKDAGTKIYNVGGQMVDGLKKGINIIRNADGSTTKVLKK